MSTRNTRAGQTAKPARARQRRKDARPGEITQAALACFLEAGFEATKLDEVAKKAGVAKGTIYVYFATKEALFRGVVESVMAENLSNLATIVAVDASFAEMLPAFVEELVRTVASSRAPAIVRLILREAERFPDLAKIWFEQVLQPTLRGLTAAIVRAQRRGEIRAGDPHAHILSILGPIFVATMVREVLGPVGLPATNIATLASQHVETVLQGLRTKKGQS